MSTTFPERMHAQAVETHTRRVERALKELANEVAVIQRRVSCGNADADDARKAAELVTTIASRLGSLEALRDVREWGEADEAGRHYEATGEVRTRLSLTRDDAPVPAGSGPGAPHVRPHVLAAARPSASY